MHPLDHSRSVTRVLVFALMGMLAGALVFATVGAALFHMLMPCEICTHGMLFFLALPGMIAGLAASTRFSLPAICETQ